MGRFEPRCKRHLDALAGGFQWPCGLAAFFAACSSRLSRRRRVWTGRMRHGLRCVRVIHGKGNGSPGREPVLKLKVQTWLVQKKEVIAFAQARASEGGNGALVVLLAPGRI